jgi:hypothetical protein
VILDLHWNARGGERSTGQQPMADSGYGSLLVVGRAGVQYRPTIVFHLYNEPWKTGRARPCRCDGAGSECEKSKPGTT